MVTIVQTTDTLNGEPRIDGTRIDVLNTAELVLDDGYTPADTTDQLALAVAAIYHACAYYHGHPKKMRDSVRNGA